MFGQRPGIPVFGPSDWGEYIENITKAIERGTPLTPEEFYGCEIEEGVYI
uniref:Putative selenoprotein n=1 Tax=Siphoviridae sp. ctQCU10 TaxID=2823579 RepID=A0A8S5LAZ7_9CAUD|nr:MAG TPA: putative selenoprotein [Siphoviridae sp. ctQCU10]DAN69808.1 MAG TPA: putative Selenoprotein [Caudoviricetes sp.]DAX50307.1 MAG TPA: Selenoprotein, putative [Caudoviricetes sp.]